MSITFENNYKDIAGTELWKIFRKKCTEEGMTENFVIAVGNVCAEGIIKSKDIIRFFPTFTLHDITHIKNVCDWMIKLLGDRKDELTVLDAAALLMAACCHDIGMSVSAEQKEELINNTETQEWQDYFNINLDDWDKFKDKKVITDKMLRNYVRIYHHERIGLQITEAVWERVLNDNGLQRHEIVDLCKSHGESLEKLNVDDCALFDVRLCAVLLRLADILDFDPTRAPETLFKHIGLDKPTDTEMEKSSGEYKKNSVGKLIFRNGKIIYSAVLDSPQIKKEVEEYLNWAERELKASQSYIKKFNTDWNNLKLPQKIERKIQLSSCDSGEFKVTMNQDRIIELLTGKNLYSDPCVFVRELLQNSIDAILWREKIDRDFNAKRDGKITITTWHEASGQGWFRIEDNGTGMDKDIIEKYFLKVGCSYYNSDDFKRDKKNFEKVGDYKPISRFGIGILSCFLSDENNTLEVSTQRYSSDPRNVNAALRLSVTGLKGFYRLADSKTPKGDWQKMPVPSDEKKEYFRTEPGTTICVGMNLFSLGDYRSIKEVVDKYVQFPDMKVEYRGIDGTEVYPTKGDFLRAVAELKKENGDSFPIVCRHPIPDDEFKKLKANYPEYDWKSAPKHPELILKYYPFDSFTSRENLAGISICVQMETINAKGSYLYNNINYKYKMTANAYFSQSQKSVDIVFDSTLQVELMDRLKNTHQKNKNPFHITISYETLLDMISETEKSEAEKNTIKFTLGRILPNLFGIIAYNGVFADGIQKYSKDTKRHAILLFGKKYALKVNVARDSITNIPFEAAIELSLMKRFVGYPVNYFQYYYSSDYIYMSENMLRNIIEKHREWKSQIKFKVVDSSVNKHTNNIITNFESKSIFEIQEKINTEGKELLLYFSNDKKDILKNVALTILKQEYPVLFYGGALKDGFLLSLKKPLVEIEKIDTSDFPVQLFMYFKFPEENKCFGKIRHNSINCYSPVNSFSRWLIKNREKLEKELPEVYKKILETMLMSRDKTNIMTSLNGRLDQLKGYRNNYFNITDDIYLKEKDFA